MKKELPKKPSFLLDSKEDHEQIHQKAMQHYIDFESARPLQKPYSFSIPPIPPVVINDNSLVVKIIKLIEEEVRFEIKSRNLNHTIRSILNQVEHILLKNELLEDYDTFVGSESKVASANLENIELKGYTTSLQDKLDSIRELTKVNK